MTVHMWFLIWLLAVSIMLVWILDAIAIKARKYKKRV